MASMNKVMDPQQTAKTMQEFERQNMKMEMTEEMSESCIESALRFLSVIIIVRFLATLKSPTVYLLIMREWIFPALLLFVVTRGIN